MSDTSNLQEGLVLHHLARILKAEKDKIAAAKDYAAARKLAKGDGVDLKMLDAVRKMLGQDQFELTENYNDLIRYAKALDIPLYSQLDFFVTPDSEDDDEILLRAYAAGRRAGKTGQDQNTCPHDFAAPAGQHWLEGWHDGQAILLKAIKALAPQKLDSSNEDPDAENLDEEDQAA